MLSLANSNLKSGYFGDSGNCLLYTSEYYCFLKMLQQESNVKFATLIRNCYEKTGILNRMPKTWWNKDQQAHDDYIGVFCACIMLKEYELGSEILDARNIWRWDNLSPDSPKWKTFFYRHPGFSLIAKLAANRKPSLLDKFLFKIRLKSNTKNKEGSSGSLLTWFMCQAVKTTSYREDFNNLIVKFEDSVAEKWGSVHGMFVEYFGKEHPFAMIFTRYYWSYKK